MRPGERAYVLCLAVDKSQAAIAFRYIAGYFEHIPALAAMVTNVGPSTIDLANGVTIEVIVNSYRAVRGRSILAAIFDEAAFWRDENFASPDIEVYNAVRPGLARVPGSMLLIISSVHKRSGLLYQKIKACHGKDDQACLAVMGSTRQFNPSFPQHIIDKALEDDPERFGAEYMCRWRDDLSTFIDRLLLEAAVDKGVVVRPPAAGVHYIAACDASGGRNDSFTAAIAHRERDGQIVLDVSFERRAPFNPSQVVDEIGNLMKEYCCHQITGDNYGAQWTVEAFSKAGVRYIKSDHDRSAVYMNTLPIFTSGRARLLDNPKLISQFASLERRTFSTGRERIDPGPGHDDLCNSAAIALSLLDLKKSMNISSETVAAVSRPGPYNDGRRPNRLDSRPRMPMVFQGSVSDRFSR